MFLTGTNIKCDLIPKGVGVIHGYGCMIPRMDL